MDVSKDHLELMLTKVLTFPRNHELDQVGIIDQFCFEHIESFIGIK